jgi:transposase
VLQRVEQGEPLRHIARDYGVSYETVRRELRSARRREAGTCEQGSAT